MSEERRYSLRINAHLSAEVVNRDGKSMGAFITDLSMGGLTLEVDAMVVKHIEVIDADSGEPYFPVEASVVFTLPLSNTLSRIEVPCRLVNKRRLSQNTFKIGMMILAINEGQHEQLAHYIDVAGNP
ncbi:MAG: PilZ domain-containing protein [Gammaproteobacteria bacterium]|nr:PilZ domain-containing protein [Gammaproteobacteria bacterium]